MPKEEPGGLRHAVPRRLDRGVPGREPGADRHAAAAAAARVLRPRHRDRPDPPRSHPGRGRAPLRAQGHRAGAGHLRPPRARAGARAHQGRPAVPGAAHGDGGHSRRLQPRRRRPAAPRHGLQARGRAHRVGQAEALRRHGSAAASPATWPTRSTSRSCPSPTSASPSRTPCPSRCWSTPRSWFKLHYPAAFLAGLLRNQPMGFYSPQSLVGDARRHGVDVRRPDVTRSAAQADLEAVVDPARSPPPVPTRAADPGSTAPSGCRAPPTRCPPTGATARSPYASGSTRCAASARRWRAGSSPPATRRRSPASPTCPVAPADLGPAGGAGHGRRVRGVGARPPARRSGRAGFAEGAEHLPGTTLAPAAPTALRA